MSLSSELLSGSSFLQLSISSPEKFTKPSAFLLGNGVEISVLGPGIIQCSPKHESVKSLVLSCGVHGNETAPIELCENWLAQILSGTIVPAIRCLLIFGNLDAIEAQTRFIDENLNRLFTDSHSGHASGSLEASRAIELMEQVDRFFKGAKSGSHCFHYDLHTAIRDSQFEKFAVFPYLGENTKRKLEDLAELKKMDVTTVLLSDRPTGTFSYYSSAKHGAQAFTIELGKVRPFGENDLSRLKQVDNAVRELIENRDSTDEILAESDFNLFRVNQTIIKTDPSFTLDFADDIANFTTFKRNTRLAFQDDADFKTQCDDEAIVFPNANVALGQRAILTVIKSGLNDDS